MRRAAFSASCGVAVLSACASPPEGLDSPEPSKQLVAMQRAADSGDRRAVPRLIEQLESDDPAVRMGAIHGLERITGQTLGYDFAAPEADRRRKVQEWVDWYHRGERGGAGDERR